MEKTTMRKSKMNEISDKLANRVANARKLNAIGAIDRYNKIDKEYDADLEKVVQGYMNKEIPADEIDKKVGDVIKKYEPLLNPEEKTIKKAEKNQELMARRTRRSKFDKRKNESCDKINEIQGNNLDSEWVIRAWMDNMDSEDGYDEIEFTKLGLIDFINSEEEDYYGDSYDEKTEPVKYDITDEELIAAINNDEFAWVLGDTASVVSIDGKPVNEGYNKTYEEEYYQHLKSDPKLYDLEMLQDSKSNLIAKAGALTDKDVAELNAVARRLKELQGKNESKINESTETLEDKAAKIGNDKKLLLKRLRDGLSVLKNEYKKEFKDYEYDFENKALHSKTTDLSLVWKNNGRTSEGSVALYRKYKINEVSREKANKVVKRRADQEYDAIVNYKINKPETVKALHNAEDKLDRALRLRRSSTKLRKDESMFNKYGEEVDPKEWENKEARGLNEDKSNEVNIFLTNLGKYNEGELVGEWVELPVDDFQPILDRIGINDEYEEWFITDYEAPFEINEYDDIEELNDIAREIQDFNSTQLEVLKAYEEAGYEMRDAIEKVIDNEFFYLEGDTEEDLAWSYIDAIGSFEDAVSKENKQYYFDYEAYGRDLVLGGDYTYVEDVVDLNSLADRDTAERVFGYDGDEQPTEEDIAKYKKWIEIYGDYTDEQEEELAKQGMEVFMTSIYVDGVRYDVETLEQVVEEYYEVQSGYKDYEDNIVDVHSEKELAEYVVDELFGGVDQLGEEELERYFDYAWWGKTLAYDFYKTDNGWVQLD
jgi:antirestriction protein